MGLFHDVCANCGNKVSKKARVCSKCGRGAPNGWTKCPACKKWVGNDSEYCPNCNHPLHPSERIDLAGGVWDREADLFAQRFELGDVGRILGEGLMVQEGTLAVLLDGGKETKVLGPGRHTPEGTLRSLNWFGNPPPRSAVLVDSGDVVFRVDFTGRRADGQEGPAGTPLRSAEELQVSAVAEITLRFAPAKAVAFLENFMKEKRSISTKDVCAWLYEEGLSAVRDLCQQSTIEDLVKDPERRPRLEEALGRALAEPLSRCGMQLVRVGAVEFYGKAYEEIRERYGELDRARRLLEFGKKQLELLAEQEQMEIEDTRLHEKRADDVKMERAKRAAEMEDYLSQLAQEKQLTEIDRTRELQIAEELAKGEVSRVQAQQAAARALEQHAKEMTALANKLELDLTLRNYDREQLLADARNQAELAAIRRRENELDIQSQVVIAAQKVEMAKSDAAVKTIAVDTEVDETRKWLGVKREKNQIENEDQREKNQIANEDQRQKNQIANEDLQARAKVLVGTNLEDKAALTNDPEARKDFLNHAKDMKKLDNDLAMSPDQHLAVASGTSSAAADALARSREAEADAKARIHEADSDARAAKQVLAEVKAAEEARLKHDEKLEEQVIDLAKTAVEHQNTIVVPGQSNIVH